MTADRAIWTSALRSLMVGREDVVSVTDPAWHFPVVTLPWADVARCPVLCGRTHLGLRITFDRARVSCGACLAALVGEEQEGEERRRMQETPQSISDWADATFGPGGSNARCAARANEEMAELLRALTAWDDDPKGREEIADIVICLCRLASRLGGDLWQDVEHKMAINRARAWRQDGTGHGYHIKS